MPEALEAVRARFTSAGETAEEAAEFDETAYYRELQRLLTEALADEILQAWFGAAPSEDSQDVTCLRALDELDGAR